MDELEKVLAEHASIRPPFDKRWKRLAAEYCAERLADIRMFRALGLQAVPDQARRDLIEAYLGPLGENDPEDYGFNVWLLNECIGDRLLSPDDIFMRCSKCHRVRTTRAVGTEPCGCGGGRMERTRVRLSTQKVLGGLVVGY